MCGRYQITVSAETLAEAFAGEPGETLLPMPPRYNIAPSQPVPIVRERGGGRRRIDLARWGLAPFWADDPAIGNRMINARAESAADKPAFRAAMRHRRCLVPATGFYEWGKGGDGGKQPHHIHRIDDQPFAFAGLWEHWQDINGNELETCCILTTKANALLSPIHPRMPVILPPTTYARWLDAAGHTPPPVTDLLTCADPAPLQAVPVSQYVNNPAHDDSHCIEPMAQGEDDSDTATLPYP